MSKISIPKIKGFTKIEVLAFVKLKVQMDSAWAIRACFAIYDEQTDDEKRKKLAVAGRNSCGFTKFDTPILSSIACKLRQNRDTLYDVATLKQMMPKYAAQLCRLAYKKDKCLTLIRHLNLYYHKDKGVKVG